ncbi:zinc finger protein 37-like, partial [Sitophilus oryzae]|uniref:Zinc finger protein 37-like n=1 Tax=Sitophilus oryzae TaxID=7048 RepID=A0A6J2YVL7_SITOR
AFVNIEKYEEEIKVEAIDISYGITKTAEYELTKANLLLHCDQCEKSFKSRKQLTGHRKSVHSEKRYQCPKCPKNYKINSQLNKHLKLHDPTNKIQCDICLKEFSNKHCFDLHMKRHNKQYVTKCEQCNTKFIAEYELRKHVAVKHNKLFLCVECGSRYSTKNALDYHMLTHDPDFKKT